MHFMDDTYRKCIHVVHDTFQSDDMLQVKKEGEKGCKTISLIERFHVAYNCMRGPSPAWAHNDYYGLRDSYLMCKAFNEKEWGLKTRL